jgi:hypothetical protein
MRGGGRRGGGRWGGGRVGGQEGTEGGGSAHLIFFLRRHKKFPSYASPSLLPKQSPNRFLIIFPGKPLLTPVRNKNHAGIRRGLQHVLEGGEESPKGGHVRGGVHEDDGL